MAGILDLMGYIQDQSEKGRQAGLSRLVGKAYGAAPDQQQQILSTVAQRGAPDMAMNADKAFGEQQDNVHLQMAKRAAEVVALYQSNPQMAQQVYQNGLLPIARRAGVPNAPMQLDASLIPGLEKLASAATIGSTAGGVQSTYIDAQGRRVAILRDGRTLVLGQNAPNNQIIDTGNGFYGVNKGNLQAAPVMVGGQQQAPQAPSGFVQTPSGPVNIDPSLPPEIRAQIAANPDAFTQGGMTQGAPVVQDGPPPMPQPSGGSLPPALDYQNGGQLRSAPKPISPAEQQRLDMERQRLTIAQQAADRAGQAAQSAADLKEGVARDKAAKATAAAQDTIDNLNDGVSQIDDLLKSPGMKYLGSVEGDAMLHIPVVRNSAKDANAKLDVIRNRVVLNTLSSLKSLSANGASGFGALSNQEGEILRNSIASLSNAQTNAQIVEGLKRVQAVMRRSAERIRALRGGQAAPSQAAPQSGDLDAILSKYGVK